jgi:vitamin B12 transporter
MNQFLSRVFPRVLVIFALFSSSGLWAEGLGTPTIVSPFPGITPVNTVMAISPAAPVESLVNPVPPVVPVGSVTVQPSIVVPASTVVSAATPVVIPVTTIVSKKNLVEGNVSSLMDEVVITANRLDVPEEDVTSSSTVITAKELEQKQAGTVQDAVQGVSGVDVAQEGNPGEISSVYIRGMASEFTLVLYDGIPLNDPVGTTSSYEFLDGLSLDGVKQIEVIQGPQSTLWGSSAAGGVINIIPQSGPSPLGGSVLMEGGSYGTSREVISAQGGDNNGYFNFDASHYNTAGFPALDTKGLDASDAALESVGAGTVNNGDDNTSASLRLGSNLASNLEEKVLVRYNVSNTSVDAYNSNSSSQYWLADDPDYFILQKQFFVGSLTDWKLLDGSWEQQLNVSFSDDEQIYTGTVNPYSAYTENGSYDGQTTQINWQNNIRLAKEETIILGIQGQKQWASVNDTSSSYGIDSLPVTTVQTGSGFAESQTSIDDRLFVNLGGRWEDQSQYGVHTTYQAGLAYFLPVLDTKVKANYGTGFAAPSLWQLYDPNYGNPNLQPETTSGYDFGFEQPIGGKNFINIGASYFDNELTNLFGYDAQYQTININNARTNGVESFVEFKGLQDLSFKASYTYDNAQDLTDNIPLARRPQNKADGDIDYKWGNAGFGASLIYTGDVFDEDFNGNPITLPSYFLLNLRASYQVNSQVKLFARVDNLFNQWYEEAYGYSTPGLSAYGGTKVSF